MVLKLKAIVVVAVVVSKLKEASVGIWSVSDVSVRSRIML